MRRLLLAIPLIVATPALAQSQAAMPVEPFTEGQRAGIPSRPLVVLTVSQALPVASLPASCTDGQLVLATDGRTPMQDAGKGTGVVARCLSKAWLSTVDGKAVQS
ncbi:hypothetical protein [Gluconobacter roseus]|nr:hypothetical protein [Gluconobacter roseus]KXV43051.1 hypothetical protein AD943_08660 [Gluconobacter roseus]